MKTIATIVIKGSIVIVSAIAIAVLTIHFTSLKQLPQPKHKHQLDSAPNGALATGTHDLALPTSTDTDSLPTDTTMDAARPYQSTYDEIKAIRQQEVIIRQEPDPFERENARLQTILDDLTRSE